MVKDLLYNTEVRWIHSRNKVKQWGNRWYWRKERILKQKLNVIRLYWRGEQVVSWLKRERNIYWKAELSRKKKEKQNRTVVIIKKEINFHLPKQSFVGLCSKSPVKRRSQLDFSIICFTWNAGQITQFVKP